MTVRDHAEWAAQHSLIHDPEKVVELIAGVLRAALMNPTQYIDLPNPYKETDSCHRIFPTLTPP